MGKAIFDFKGEVVAITGAAGGIAKGIAIGFGKAGANVVIGDLKEDAGMEVVDEICKLGGDAVFVKTDVTDMASVDGFIQTAICKYGKLDILVNGAGVANKVLGSPFTDLRPGDFEFTYKVNVVGAVNTCQKVYPIFKEQGHGRIINLSSTVGHSTNPLTVPYAVSKAAVINLTINLAKELAPYGTTVNALCPGYVLTPMYADNLDTLAAKIPPIQGMNAEEMVDWMAANNCATKKPQTVEDMANATLFLASEEAANITGEILDVAGGYKL